MAGRPLGRRFFLRPVLTVARDLLGRDLTTSTPDGEVTVRLVEVEAYRGADDPGSHAFRGRTARNAVMFGEPGHLYVYFTYGMHWCANLVCEPEGQAAAVLLRAAEVIDGVELASARRRGSRPRDLGRGPARLAKALGLDGTWDGTDVVGGAVRLTLGVPVPDGVVRAGPRVGVAGAGASTPWRLWVAGSPHVSDYRPAVRRQRSQGAAVPDADGAGDAPGLGE